MRCSILIWIRSSVDLSNKFKVNFLNGGSGENLGQVTPQTRDEIQNVYQAKVAEVGNNIGGIQIEPNLSSQQTIQKIKAEADNLNFDDESAAIYHTEKHYDEFPPSHKTGENKFGSYWQSAIETIKKSQNVTTSYDQLSGNRSFVFNHTYKEKDVNYSLKTIVNVSPEGIVKIATYFKQ